MDRYRKTLRIQFGTGEEGQECCLDPFGHLRFIGRKGWTPNTDILETEDAVVILMDLAGIERDDIKILHQGDLLQVSGMRTRRNVSGTRRFHRMEIDYGPFEKVFRVPPDLDLERVKAEHRDGILELTLPKTKIKEPIQIVIVPEESY